MSESSEWGMGKRVKRIRTVQDVADWRLCQGCGACEYICPKKTIKLIDFVEEGIRPRLMDADCGTCTKCLDVCPGLGADHRALANRPLVNKELKKFCGPVLDIYEGHAGDRELRWAGSSGGAISALALYCLEIENMGGVLHVGARDDDVTRNKTVLSRTRRELLLHTGSRYAPTSTCDGLGWIEREVKQCAFVGNPAQITALRKAEGIRPELKAKVGLAISFFCAGEPSTEGTLELIKSMGKDPGEVSGLRYRGDGWPGNFEVKSKERNGSPARMPYSDSWGFLQAYRPLSQHIWPDGSGEDADISCGDPWYRKIEDGEAGSSLIIARTEKGREIVRGAIKHGYLVATGSTAERVRQSQKNLFDKRRTIWGRVATMRLLGLPAPRFRGFSLFRLWLGLPWREKGRSTMGTVRRVLKKGYYKRANFLEKRE